MKVVRQAHGHHRDAPEYHDAWYEDARAESFEEDVCERLEERVGDEDEGEGCVGLPAGDVQGLFEPVEARVADVGAVEEGDEVEEGEPGD